MSRNYIQLSNINFIGPTKRSSIDFSEGVNVICGASDTGKSFLAETIDFMLGGSTLKEIPERDAYASIDLEFNVGADKRYQVERAISGGDFALTDLKQPDKSEAVKLKQQHAHDRTDNLSGFLLDQIGLLGKRILKSSAKGTTNSLSFRNLAQLVIVQEGEIQQSGSPFWDGQFTQKTSSIATIKLLLTGIDDSAVVSASGDGTDNTKQLALIDELLADLSSEITDKGYDQAELVEQLERLDSSIKEQRESLSAVQATLDEQLALRRTAIAKRTEIQERIAEIGELLERFKLLHNHYEVDKARLDAILESGSLFAHIEKVPCPMCGASPEHQHLDEKCDGDVGAIVQAATAEIAKIDQLSTELNATVSDLQTEAATLSEQLIKANGEYEIVDIQIRQNISPVVGQARADFSALIEKRAAVQTSLDMFARVKKLQDRKAALLEADAPSEKTKISTGIPEAVAHAFSMKIEHILRAWNFPGDCRVHFDKEKNDFVIDGKPRGSRGKGLRAITHAAITIGLLEFCRERSLPHPGFVVMDSPLLAYFKPEGEEDVALQGTDLKERFYQYLITHHARNSQVIVIENQHPPLVLEKEISMTVFTGNPQEGRFGLL